jgi:hypothetical protein
MQKVEPQFRQDPRWVQPRGPGQSRPVHPAVAELRAPGGQASTAAAARALLTRPATWLAAVLAAPLAFLATLWLTSPKPPSPWVATLANATVSDSTSLMATVQTAGLRGTSDVKGAIEEMSRVDGERVLIRGWATDATSSVSPLTVIAFAGRAHVLAVVNEISSDAAHFAGLSGATATTTSFNGTVACKRGEKLIVVAVTAERKYSQFRSLVCP